jgi:pilus biogenesis lipoprotein CpaD
MYSLSHRIIGKTGLKFAAALAFAAGLSGCGAQATSYNPAVAHPVNVSKKTASVAVNVSAVDGSVSLTHQSRLKAFVVDYVRRAQSPMLVMTAPGIGLAAAETKGTVVRDMLVKAGMRPGDVLLKPGMSTLGGRNTVVISFRGYAAEVPTCGDWSTESSFMPNNGAHGNFGCAYQRNIGLMVSNPRDLVRSEAPGTADAARRTQVILNNRAGDITGSAISGTEESGVGGE